MNKPICLFDSGIGGLTVLKKLLEKFPDEDYIYLADLARVPFGDKTKEEINSIVNEIVKWLVKFDPKTIIMACNTSSALVLTEYQNKLNVPIYGMIESCAKEIANSKYKRISVWATNLVANSAAYKKAVQKTNNSLEVEEIACPKLVPMIEDLNYDNDEKENIIREYLEKTSKDSEALILGCTHYPIIQDKLSELTKVHLIDPAVSLINEFSRGVVRNASGGAKPQISLYTTAQADKMRRFANLYLCGDFKVNLISLNTVAV
ncbi:MAG: glutamate racemase [Candidatus Melainabacteria bacterium RIFCSPHIGHO2_02_FULL_34_12]|nr:MAG: glutamate racemase [Candidatus Melainabacteria bacterium RIFCSPHIGHO2_02_FULL_34_12]